VERRRGLPHRVWSAAEPDEELRWYPHHELGAGVMVPWYVHTLERDPGDGAEDPVVVEGVRGAGIESEGLRA